jgi:DNA-directed RNA polymerase subunit RPC12/RpoP
VGIGLAYVLLAWALTDIILGVIWMVTNTRLVTDSKSDMPVPPVKRAVASGRQRFICPRCGADNDVPDVDASYDCWRCAEHRTVKPKVEAALTAPAAKRTVRCPQCDAEQKIPLTAAGFTCGRCKEISAAPPY